MWWVYVGFLLSFAIHKFDVNTDWIIDFIICGREGRPYSPSLNHTAAGVEWRENIQS